MTMVELTDEDFAAAAEVPITAPTTTPQPTIKREHRCPRMREHLAGWADVILSSDGLANPRPGESPGDLPVPCPDCYSVTVIGIPGPYLPPIDKQPLTEVLS